MTKIMLVEDDKSLREIYGVRLLAEGYDIVSAGDGEEALAMAIKERPRLIISDVMMPKVSGYDMLDILRSTTETRNIRVIMMTALSSEEQRLRAESLGADRYLVKSQVGIEDVVRVVHEILEDTPAAAAATTPPLPTSQPQATPASPTTPAPPTSAPAKPAEPQPPQPAAVSPTLNAQINDAPKPASLKTRVIQPLNDPNTSPVDINDLLDKELAKEAGLSDAERPVVASVSQEKALLEEQLKSFVPPEPSPVAAPATTPPVQQPSTNVLPTPGLSVAPATTPPPAKPSTPPPAASPTPTAPPMPNELAMPKTIPRVEVNDPTVPKPPLASTTPTVTPPASAQPSTPSAPPTLPKKTVIPVTSPLPTPTPVTSTPSPAPLATPSVTTNTGPSPVVPAQAPKVQ